MIGENKYTGEYKHSIDPKSRVFIPSSMRDDMGEEVYIVKGVDPCIAVYPSDAWEAFTDKLNTLPEIQARRVKRFIYSSAVRTKVDSQGRILIPQNLKEYAELGKNVYFVGVGNHAEIWNEEKWINENDVDSEELVGTLIELGF